MLDRFKRYFQAVRDYFQFRRELKELERSHVSTFDKCPACGHSENHSIVYSEQFQKLIHRCEVCRAMWGSPCIVAPTKWHIDTRQLDPEDFDILADLHERADAGYGVKRVATKVSANVQ